MATKKAPYKIEEKEKSTVIKWDDLVPLYTSTNSSLTTCTNALKETYEAFGDVIDGDAMLTKTYTGTVKTFIDLNAELIDIVSIHSKKVQKGDVTEYMPFTGVVSDDEKHQETYLYIVMAYGGLNDKVGQVMDNTMTTLMGGIKEKATILEEAITVAQETTKAKEDIDAGK